MEVTTRDKIIASGKQMFLKKGFKSAPLRKIVAEAGYTQGAFYGYFNTKEDLFYAIVDDFINKTLTMLNQVIEDINNLPTKKRLLSMNECFIKRLPQIVSHLANHKDELKLVLLCSQGTKYENILTVLANRNIKYLKKYLKVNSYQENLINILINSYFSILGKIILEHKNEDEMLKLMRDIHTIFNKGIMDLYNKKEK